MSYTTHIPDPPTRQVLKKCYCGTCGRHIKSSLNNMIDNHKLELFLIIMITIWFIVCTVLFCVAAESAEYRPNIWMAFAGLAFCLPATLLICFCIVSSCMYFRRIYIIAEDETQRSQNPGVYESWHVNKSIMLYNVDDPIVRVMEQSVNGLADVSVEI